MYGIVYFTDFTVYKQQLQIVHESFHTDRPTISAVTWYFWANLALVLVIFTVNVLFYSANWLFLSE